MNIVLFHPLNTVFYHFHCSNTFILRIMQMVNFLVSSDNCNINQDRQCQSEVVVHTHAHKHTLTYMQMCIYVYKHVCTQSLYQSMCIHVQAASCFRAFFSLLFCRYAENAFCIISPGLSIQ